jgi:hypothetical protein
MAKKIRLIDDVENNDSLSLTEAPKGDMIDTAFTKEDAATLMKLAEAIAWKLRELLKFTRKFEATEDET